MVPSVVMLGRRTAWVLCLTLGAASAWAKDHRRVREFEEPTEEQRSKTRGHVNTWVEAEPIVEERFPWLKVGMVVLAFAGVAPFAWNAYRRSASELNASRAAFGTGKRRKTLDP